MSISKQVLIPLFAVFALVAFSATASAVPLGTLSLAACTLPPPGGGVTVTATTIDWLPGGGGTGCIITGDPTNVTYTGGGPLLAGVTGAIKDLPAGPTPVLDFMTFTGNTNLHFDLSGLGPGSVNTTCAASFTNPDLPACSVFPGSPFILAPSGLGTTVSLSAFGIARDTSTLLSNWIGVYTTQFAGRTPASIQANILSGGSETNTESGHFTLTAIPEPASLTLLGMGLLGTTLAVRKRRRG